MGDRAVRRDDRSPDLRKVSRSCTASPDPVHRGKLEGSDLLVIEGQYFDSQNLPRPKRLAPDAGQTPFGTELETLAASRYSIAKVSPVPFHRPRSHRDSLLFTHPAITTPPILLSHPCRIGHRFASRPFRSPKATLRVEIMRRFGGCSPRFTMVESGVAGQTGPPHRSASFGDLNQQFTEVGPVH